MKASNFAYWFSNAYLNLRPYNRGGPQVYLATWVRSLIKTVHLRVYNGVAFIVYFFCAKLSILHFILSKGENCYDTKLAAFWVNVLTFLNSIKKMSTPAAPCHRHLSRGTMCVTTWTIKISLNLPTAPPFPNPSNRRSCHWLNKVTVR